jgi:hypothetical protein
VDPGDRPGPFDLSFFVLHVGEDRDDRQELLLY